MNYGYHDPENPYATTPSVVVGDPIPPPMIFNDPKPEFGYEFVPPEGTVPQPAMMKTIALALLKKLEDAGSKYNG